jgi:hypothetical protein
MTQEIPLMDFVLNAESEKGCHSDPEWSEGEESRAWFDFRSNFQIQLQRQVATNAA